MGQMLCGKTLLESVESVENAGFMILEPIHKPQTLKKTMDFTIFT
jgi:hypothetical protein